MKHVLRFQDENKKWISLTGYAFIDEGGHCIIIVYGEKKRELCIEVPSLIHDLNAFENPQIAMPGVIAMQTNKFIDYVTAKTEMDALDIKLKPNITSLTSVMFIIICDDATFTANTLNNYLWVAYTRCNPSHDIYGIDSFTSNKHWGCNGPLIIDARIKPHHAPTVEKDPATEKKIDRLFEKGASLYQIMK